MTAIAPTTLAQIALSFAEAELLGDGGVTLRAVTDDSRCVEPGTLYVALDTRSDKGAAFLRGALARGAAAILVERDARPLLAETTSALMVTDVRRAFAQLSASVYGNAAARLRIAGITGTNGKTTTSFMLAALLADAGYSPLRIGTLGAAWAQRTETLGYTTPPPLQLHALFARALADGADTAVMEVSSHALALGRVAEVPIEIGVFTNLSRDHLDFHDTMSAYAAAKRELFVQARTAVFNLDDAYGVQWYREFGGVSYAIEHDADIVARNLVLDADESRFVVDGVTFVLPMPGRFNVANALAAIAAGRLFKIDPRTMQKSLANFRGVPGRMERFARAGCSVVVDYAHTPDALERVLAALTETGRPVTVVFGCGGGRDAGKRPQMGAIAARLAARVIVTSDNPRGEDPQTIADAVLAGAGGSAECVLDRATAIERAITEAPAEAIVLVAGKGAETEQLVGSSALPFDDRREAERALALRVERSISVKQVRNA